MASAVEDHRLSELVNPTPKQRECIEATDKYRFVLYGGAAGGGKSYLLRWWCLRQLLKRYAQTGIQGLMCGLFSIDYPTLQDRQISKIEREFPVWLGQTKRTEKEGLCFFVKEEFGGGRIALRNLQDPNSYKSAEFCDIAIEELTESDYTTFEDLVLFRLRTPGIDRPCFLGATNPTGKGLQWVKALWPDANFRSYPQLQHLRKEFGYVPALLQDNPYLGTEYRNSLQGLNEKKRKALLEGDWTVPEGQYFSNFEASERTVSWRVVNEIVQPWWSHWISQDWGFGHATSTHWHAVGNVTPEMAKLLGRDWETPRRCVFTYREQVASLRDEGLSEAQYAAKIQDRTGAEKISAWILSSDAFGEKTSQNTAAELLESGAPNLPSPQKANMKPGSRIVGWRFMYGLIQSDSWFISDLCPEALNAVPAAEYDPDSDEDVLKTDHLYDDVIDELRYGLVDMLGTKGVPVAVQRAEVASQFVEDGVIVDHTELAMAMAKFNSEHRNKGRRRAKWSVR